MRCRATTKTTAARPRCCATGSNRCAPGDRGRQGRASAHGRGEGTARTEPKRVQLQAEALRERLLAKLPAEAAAAWTSDHPSGCSAYLVDWHRREVNAEWWEYFRLMRPARGGPVRRAKGGGGPDVRGAARGRTQREDKGKPTVGDRPLLVSACRTSSSELGKLTCRTASAFGKISRHDRAQTARRRERAEAAPTCIPPASFAADVISTDDQQKSVVQLAEIGTR